jgi:hypothetical protein
VFSTRAENNRSTLSHHPFSRSLVFFFFQEKELIDRSLNVFVFKTLNSPIDNQIQIKKTLFEPWRSWQYWNPISELCPPKLADVTLPLKTALNMPF